MLIPRTLRSSRSLPGVTHLATVLRGLVLSFWRMASGQRYCQELLWFYLTDAGKYSLGNSHSWCGLFLMQRSSFSMAPPAGEVNPEDSAISWEAETGSRSCGHITKWSVCFAFQPKNWVPGSSAPLFKTRWPNSCLWFWIVRSSRHMVKGTVLWANQAFIEPAHLV